MCGILRLKNIIRDNKGSATIEISLIMPIILCILAMFILLFIDSVSDGIIHGEIYTAIYTYDETVGSAHMDNEVRSRLSDMLLGQEEKLDIMVVKTNDSIGINADGIHRKTEYGICTERLRRWQLYGDILWE